MSDLLLDQFARMLAALERGVPAELERSGFLDLLAAEKDGAGGGSLEELLALVLAVGARPEASAIIHTMVARAKVPAAVDVADCEPVLIAAGVEPFKARTVAAALSAGLMAGAMQGLLEKTVDYAGVRRQFGREIGAFQAVQHQIAVMAEECLAARMSVQMVFAGASIDGISPLRAAIAKLRAGQAAIVVGATAHAVHGAIGISEECDLHHLTLALHRLRRAHGGESYWARYLGRHLLSGASDLVTTARTL
jgi:acyl-CoA dehydrogenase